jgi:hypothetical protein
MKEDLEEDECCKKRERVGHLILKRINVVKKRERVGLI